MSNLMQKIKDAQVQERKKGADKDMEVIAFLTTLYSECANVGKNENRETSDDDVIAVLRKFLKVAESNLAIYQKANKNEAVNQVQKEMKILEQYLPQSTSDDEILQAISNIATEQNLAKSPSSVGALMKGLKAKYGATLDGSKASALVKKYLS